MTTTTLPLTKEHEDELLGDSLICPEVVAARGYRSVKASEVPDTFANYQKRDGLLIPIRNVDGRITTYQLKPTSPRVLDGRTIKYETAANAPMCLDVPLSVKPLLKDPSVPLWITEGAKKVDSALSHGIPCIIGVQGVFGWRGKNDKGGKMALADWESVALNGRQVILAFDSDCMTKASVRDALVRLAAFLSRKGAAVRYCLIPTIPSLPKMGLDDHFAYFGRLDDLLERTVDELPPLVGDGANGEPVIFARKLSLVEKESVEWLWPGWLPKGMLTILGGHGGDGKSTVIAAIAALLSAGKPLPDGTATEPTGVLFMSAEDDISRVLAPRLDVHGGDLDRITILDGWRDGHGKTRWLDIRRDIAMLRAVIEQDKIGLLVIDPLSSYLPSADRNNEGEIRDALQPFQAMLQETGCAAVAIMHVGKANDNRRASQKLLGSTAFTALARSVLMIADAPMEMQPDDRHTSGSIKVLQVVKANYTIAPPAIQFQRPLDQPIRWLGITDLNVSDCLTSSGPLTAPGPEPIERNRAQTFVKVALQHGPVGAREIIERGGEHGLSQSSLQRAATGLGVIRYQFHNKGPYYWRLPDDSTATSPGA